MIDLHTHSSASDGNYSPAELAALGAKQGLSVFALTDHDTVMGLAEGEKAAKKEGIGFIPGIELDIARVEGASGEFHLLGLGIHRRTSSFYDAVAELARKRDKRNIEILERMDEMGIKAGYDEIKALSGGYSVGRPHFAALLVKRRVVRNMEQAFARYLGRGRPLYVPKTGMEFDQALSIIKEAGGLAVLAHPLSLYVGWGRLPDFIKNLKNRGLRGIEAWHPAAKVQDCKRLEDMGKSLGLFITAGSDFHGETRPDRKLGITAGNRKIDDSLLKAIPELLEKAIF